MGIRETLNEKNALVTKLMVLLLVVALVFMAWYLMPRKQVPPGSQQFYSDDDGTTWFADDIKKLPPFMHNGKEAVHALVFQTPDGKPFVAYLEKYTDEGKKKAESGMVLKPSRGPHHKKEGESSGVLVKKPHEGTWVDQDDQAGAVIRAVTAPDGSTNLIPVTPE